MQTVNQEYSNFVTPPDFVNESKPNVLLIDVPGSQIQSLGMYLMTCECYFNIYLYNHEMGVPEWFGDARNRADAIIVNTEPNIFSTTKDMLAELPIAWYYGPKAFLRNTQQINTPIDYFTQYVLNHNK